MVECVDHVVPYSEVRLLDLVHKSVDVEQEASKAGGDSSCNRAARLSARWSTVSPLKRDIVPREEEGDLGSVNPRAQTRLPRAYTSQLSEC